MSSDDLIEFSRQQYAKPTSIEDWTREDLITEGLDPAERQLLEHLPIRTGQLLVLNVGGGREAISLAQMGFDVTGVDFIPAMVEGAISNAARYNVQIKGIVQDLSALDVAADMFDVAWLSAAMYSCMPTRARRVQLLQRVRDALKPGGYFACQFQWDTHVTFSRKGERLRQILAWLTLGNRSYERGDMLWYDIEFIHAFSSESDLLAEFAAGGFHVIWLNLPTCVSARGEVLLQKPEP